MDLNAAIGPSERKRPRSGGVQGSPGSWTPDSDFWGERCVIGEKRTKNNKFDYQLVERLSDSGCLWSNQSAKPSIDGGRAGHEGP